MAAEYDPKKLEQTILFEWGGKQRRDDLSFASARQAFDLVLEVACRHITDLFSEREALASLLGEVDEVQTGIQELLDRPEERIAFGAQMSISLSSYWNTATSRRGVISVLLLPILTQ